MYACIFTLRKMGIEDIVNAVNGILSDDFLVQVGLHYYTMTHC